jgi:DNA-binding NtrC family response regulator
MKNNNEIQIFLVDDDAFFLKCLEIDFILQTDFIIKTFSSGEMCLENLSQNPQLIVLDYELDSIEKNAMNGLETLDKIKTLLPDMPVLIFSSQDKIEVAMNCMEHRASDYVIKGGDAFFRLKDKISNLVSLNKNQQKLNRNTEWMSLY